MNTDEITKYEKIRLQEHKICPLCNEEIKPYEDFQYLKFRRGRSILYRFFHTKCLLGGDYYGERE